MLFGLVQFGAIRACSI
jgi:Calcineurin-like phosphoesterase superfamily domain